QREVVGPLRRLPVPAEGSVVRIVADGLDGLSPATESAIREALAALASGPGLDHVRLIATARPDTDLPGGPHVVRLDEADPTLLAAYFARRGVPEARREDLAARAGGNWLVARLLAD